MQAVSGDFERLADQVNLARGDTLGVGRCFEAYQQDELVATDARQGVLAVQAGAQARGDGAQQLVAHVMAKGVVDRLETIQIDEHHRQTTADRIDLADRLADAVGQENTVGQAGQVVVQGQLSQLLVGQGQ